MKGFTLFELILVIAILAIIAAATAPFAFRFFSAQSLDDAALTMVGTLRQAHGQSVAQKNDSAFGVKFLTDSYVLFQGSSYALRSVDYDLTTDMPGNLEISGLGEVVFAKHTGIPTAVGTVTITGNETRSIQINAQGIIEML